MKLKGLYNIWKNLFDLKVKFKEIKDIESKTISWLYLDDLLPKKGDEE